MFKKIVNLFFSSTLIFTLLFFSINCGDKKNETNSKPAEKELLVPEHETPKYDFRKTYWGMSKNQVKKIETAKPKLKPNEQDYQLDNNLILENINYDDANILVYSDSLYNITPVTIIYFFKNDRLCKACYLYHNDYRFCDDAFMIFRTQLIEKYEKPQEDYFITPTSKVICWKTPRTKMLLTIVPLLKDESKGSVAIDYISPDALKEKDDDKI